MVEIAPTNRDALAGQAAAADIAQPKHRLRVPGVADLRRFAHDVGHAYRRHIVAEHKQPQMFILASFLVTFTTVRIITHDIRAGRHPGLLRNISGPGGTHIHHLVPGIFLLLISGYLGIGLAPTYHREPHAIAYGVGAALTLDEFALWLHLEDVYWAQQGRDSVDAVAIAATIAALGVLGRGFWVDLGHATERLVGLR